MKKVPFAMIAAAGAAATLICSTASAATVQMQWLKTIDISATSDLVNNPVQYIGNNPSAVAFNGTDLWVGGYNASGGTAATGIVKISNALGAHSIGSSFGTFGTANSRGLTQLAVKGNILGASLDNGAGAQESVRAFDASTGALNWKLTTPDSGASYTRRAEGVAFDPGLNAGPGANTGGLSYIALSSGRRHNLDAVAGTYLNGGPGGGGIINFSPASTTFRGMAYDPATGDLYTRESNRLGKALRTGDNTFGTQVAIGGLVSASGVDNQCLAFLDTAAYGKLLIVNDRISAAGGQAFTSVVKVFDSLGNVQVLDLGLFSAASGNGAYNFSFDSGSQTLAISDFANRQVYLFQVPTPGAASLLGLAGLAGLRRRR